MSDSTTKEILASVQIAARVLDNETLHTYAVVSLKPITL